MFDKESLSLRLPRRENGKYRRAEYLLTNNGNLKLEIGNRKFKNGFVEYVIAHARRRTREGRARIGPHQNHILESSERSVLASDWIFQDALEHAAHNRGPSPAKLVAGRLT